MDSMPLTFELPGEDELATSVLSAGHSYYMPLIFMRQEVELRKYLDFNPDFGATEEDEEAWSRSFLHLVRKVTYAYLVSSKKNENRKRLLLKSPVHTGRVHLLRKLFPKAQFIYVHRHPEVVFQSSAHMADTTYWYCYLNTPSNEQVTEFILWQFEYLWKLYNDAVQVRNDGDNDSVISINITDRIVTKDVLEVSYNQLITEPLYTLRSIYKHINSDINEPHFKQQIQALHGYQINTHPLLSEDLKRVLRRRWGDYYDTFKYK